MNLIWVLPAVALLISFTAGGVSALSLDQVTIKSTDGILHMYQIAYNFLTLENQRGDLECTDIQVKCESTKGVDVYDRAPDGGECYYPIYKLPDAGEVVELSCAIMDTDSPDVWVDLPPVTIVIEEAIEAVLPAGDGTAPMAPNKPYSVIIRNMYTWEQISDPNIELYYAVPDMVEYETSIHRAEMTDEGLYQIVIDYPIFFPAAFPGYMVRPGLDSIIPLALYSELFSVFEITQTSDGFRAVGEPITRAELEDMYKDVEYEEPHGCKMTIGHCTLEQVGHETDGIALEGQCEGLDLTSNPPIQTTCETRYGSEVLGTNMGMFDMPLSNTIYNVVPGEPFKFETMLSIDNDLGYLRVSQIKASITFNDRPGALSMEVDVPDISLPATFSKTMSTKEVENNINSNTFIVSASSDNLEIAYTIRKGVVFYKGITTSVRASSMSAGYFKDGTATVRVERFNNLEAPKVTLICALEDEQMLTCGVPHQETQEGNTVVYTATLFRETSTTLWRGILGVYLFNPYDGTTQKHTTRNGHNSEHLVDLYISNVEGDPIDHKAIVGQKMYIRLNTNYGFTAAKDAQFMHCYSEFTKYDLHFEDKFVWSVVPKIAAAKKTITCEHNEKDKSIFTYINTTFAAYEQKTVHRLLDVHTVFTPHSNTKIASSKFIFSICEAHVLPGMEEEWECMKPTVIPAGEPTVDGMGGAECTVATHGKRENAEDFLAECLQITDTWDGLVEIKMGENTLGMESLVPPVVLPLMVSHPDGEVATVMIPSHNISPTAHDAICQTGTGLEKHQPDGGRKLVCGDKSEHLIWFTIPNENANAWDGKYQLKYDLNGVKYTFQGTAGVISIAMRPRVLVRGSFVSEATMTINEYGYPTTKSGFWMTLVNSDGLIEWTANGIYDNPGGSPRGKYTYENVPIPDNGKPITLWFRIDDQTGFYVPMTVESKPTAEADGHFVRGVDESFQVSLVGNPPIVSNLNARCGPAQPAPAFQSEVMKWDPDTKQYTCDVTGFDSVWRGKTYIFIDGMTMLVTQEITEPEPPALSTGAIIGIAFAVAVVVAVVVLALLYFYAPTMCISKNTARTISDEQI